MTLAYIKLPRTRLQSSYGCTRTQVSLTKIPTRRTATPITAASAAKALYGRALHRPSSAIQLARQARVTHPARSLQLAHLRRDVPPSQAVSRRTSRSTSPCQTIPQRQPQSHALSVVTLPRVFSETPMITSTRNLLILARNRPTAALSSRDQTHRHYGIHPATRSLVLPNPFPGCVIATATDLCATRSPSSISTRIHPLNLGTLNTPEMSRHLHQSLRLKKRRSQ